MKFTLHNQAVVYENDLQLCAAKLHAAVLQSQEGVDSFDASSTLTRSGNARAYLARRIYQWAKASGPSDERDPWGSCVVGFRSQFACFSFSTALRRQSQFGHSSA